MGCYGIGVTRTMAASIEQHNDENGIIWPVSIAPYEVVVLPVNGNDAGIAEAAEAIYRELLAGGTDAILDDRDERAGVKFNDADLIGYPVRVTVGNKAVGEGKVEIKIRRFGSEEEAAVEKAADRVREIIGDLREKNL